MNRTIIGALCLIVCIGCAPQARYDTLKRKPTTEIDVFRDGQKPTKPYNEIGMLTDDGRAVEQPTIESKFVKKAKNMGGQAILILPKEVSGSEMHGFSVVQTFLYKAIVVVYQ